MNYEQYVQHFDFILNNEHTEAPYNNPEYVHHVKMNNARSNRWAKTATVLDEASSILQNIEGKQQWIVITEPWCGDAAHIVPIIHLMASVNPEIAVDYQLRDSAPFLIDQYLTNGGKSIPILIIRDEEGKDLAVWGPRPAAAQTVFMEMKAAEVDFDTLKEALQKWYNEDKSASIQKEITALLK